MVNNNSIYRRRFLKSATGFFLITSVAGCLGGQTDDSGSKPTPTPDSSSGSDDSGSLEQAAKAEGEVKVGQSSSGWKPYFNQWSVDVGVEVNLVRTNSDKIAARALAQYNAGKMTFDMIGYGSGAEVFLQTLKSGLFQQFVPSYVEENAPGRMIADNRGQTLFINESLALLYNKNTVGSPPSDLEEWIEWDKSYALDVRDSELLAALQQRYGEQKGTELTAKLAEGATWRDSHFTSAKHTASGEIDAALTYKKFVGYDWAGPLEVADIDGFPKFASAAIYGVPKNAPHLNAAHLLLNDLHKNIVPWLNGNIAEVYHTPENISDSWFVWDLEFVSNTDLDKLDSEWKETAGLS